jgi:hypothetical protein
LRMGSENVGEGRGAEKEEIEKELRKKKMN